jgi:hypothetical protein
MGDYFSYLYNGGFVAGWEGVSSTARDSHGPLRWLQVGLIHDAGGLAFYVEYRNGDWSTHTFPVKSYTAAFSTQYILELYHNGPGVWTASIQTYPGGTLLFTVTENVAVDGMQYQGEADNLTTQCNVMEMVFWGMAWPKTQMNPPTGNSTAPYWIDTTGGPNDASFVGP